MPKCQFIDPKQVRKPGKVELGEIVLNQYKKSFAEEKKIFSKANFLGIYQDMQYIRGTDAEQHRLELADVLHVLVDAEQIVLAEDLLLLGEGLLVLVELDLTQLDDAGLSDLFRVDELTFRHLFRFLM